jgi:CRISPR-associated endonuclease Csn1
VRDLSYDKLLDQIVYYSVDTFDSVVVNGESLAAKRSKDKRQRRQLRVRRNRLWATLALLIKYNLCPLKQEELDAWRIYDKRRGYFRKYPINSKSFSQWIALDFNGDGTPDYKTPFEIRHLLATVQLDFMKTENRYLLGRALYHIAQRRGFKSNKKGIGKGTAGHEVTEKPIIDMAEQLKKSELQKSNKLQAYMDNHNPQINTVGSAYHLLLTEGFGEDLTGPIRVRGSEYEAVRSQLQDEIRYIFNFQEGLKDEKECLEQLLCDKEGSGTIFFKNPVNLF